MNKLENANSYSSINEYLLPFSPRDAKKAGELVRQIMSNMFGDETIIRSKAFQCEKNKGKS